MVVVGTKFLLGGVNVKKIVGIISMLALVMLIGCGKAESPQEKFQRETTATIEGMKQKIDKLQDAYDAKTIAMRKEFDEKMAAAKKKYTEAVASLKEQQAAATKELADMKSATGEAWEKAKEKMDKMSDEMEKAYEKIKSELKD
jgi:hypothetical protein